MYLSEISLLFSYWIIGIETNAKVVQSWKQFIFYHPAMKKKTSIQLYTPRYKLVLTNNIFTYVEKLLQYLHTSMTAHDCVHAEPLQLPLQA